MDYCSRNLDPRSQISRISLESLIHHWLDKKVGEFELLYPTMPVLVAEKKRITNFNLCFSSLAEQAEITHSILKPCLSGVVSDHSSNLLPGLPDDVAKHCIALVPRSNLPTMGGVCKKWRSFIHSKEFITVRRLAGVLEEWLYVLTMEAEGQESHWEVLDYFGNKYRVLPPMPGLSKVGFGVVVLNGKLLVMAGYALADGSGSVSADVYQYDSCLNSWSKLANMNVPRYEFACADVNGLIYVVGGHGMDGESLSSAEVYNPETDKWTMIEGMRRPRWGCFACGLDGKLYVMGGRSSFTIGNSRFVDIYSPEDERWCEMKNGCVMVTAHAILGQQLYCMEWKNQRKVSIFNSQDGSWKSIPIPLTGSSSIGFRFGIIDGKLLLFSVKKDPGYRTLAYNPDAAPGSEWQTCDINPSGHCLSTVTIKA